MGMKTVKRVFATVRAIVNLSISEEGLDCTNAFSKTYFPENGVEAKRQPIPIQSIRSIQRLCRSLDDDMSRKEAVLPRYLNYRRVLWIRRPRK